MSSSSVGRTTSEFKGDFRDIVEFNQALIYGFDPEESMTHPETSDSVDHYFEYLKHGYSQFRDMHQAYLYAQNEALPLIKKVGFKNLTPEMIIDISHQAHLYIAKSLLADAGRKSGEFTTFQIVRWHYTFKMEEFICNFAGGGITEAEALKNGMDMGVPREQLLPFLRFINSFKEKHIQKDKTSYAHLLKHSSPPVAGGWILGQVINAFHEGGLTNEEKSILEPIILITLPPEKIPGAYLAFAKELVTKLANLNRDNLDEVVSLVNFIFIKITDIHPYENGNGRIATLFLNLILRALGYHDILMRNPGERNVANSSYSLAIKEISRNPQLLHDHIRNRIVEEKQFEDYPLKQTILLRLELLDCLERIRAEFSKFPINETHIQLITSVLNPQLNRLLVPYAAKSTFSKEMLAGIGLTDQKLENGDAMQVRWVWATQKELEYFKNVYKHLKSQQPKMTASSVVTAQFTPDQQNKIVAKMTELTQLSPWKTFKDKNKQLGVRLEVKEEKEARVLAEKLTATKAMTVALKMNPETKCPVVSVSQIQYDNLMKLKQINLEVEAIKDRSRAMAAS